MKVLFGMLLMLGGLCGMAIAFCGNIVVNSSLPIIDGLELSIGLGLFSIIVFLGGIYNLFWDQLGA